ncbi:hypothetical protein Godav_010172 [Gossypium davidsonii]|uniref:Peptidase C1A papain C-terminal domain-containing protein n=1 Tax=Gossypium davidsonii TaxID=34287 RepID=A0A7J8SFM6_GOSDV|nr:hypothetical protein [Gossypium davidsonii]
MVPENDEEALLKVVMNQPVSVVLEGHGRDFQFYNGRVFTGDCGNSLSHAVTIGETWGENGYMKIQRNVNMQGGLCGIAMKGSYPIAYVHIGQLL